MKSFVEMWLASPILEEIECEGSGDENELENVTQEEPT